MSFAAVDHKGNLGDITVDVEVQAAAPDKSPQL